MPNKHITVGAGGVGGGWYKLNKHLFQLIQKNPNFASIIFPKKASTKNKVWGYTDMIIRFMGMDLKVEW